ncbi:PilN domain-containing protein [Ensifer soli]|uniref:PilN domain-containing protein n=1 Tax=Ciceribacter sp. sgz301302 TaxID=3342379 RepID=UPI0035B71DE8
MSFSFLSGAPMTAARDTLIGRHVMPLVDAFVDVIEPVFSSRRSRTRLIAVADEDDGMSFYQVHGRTATFLGNGDGLRDRGERVVRRFRKGDVELRLPADKLVFASIKVPREALAYVPQIVESRLDRLTPWATEKLLYGFDASAKPGPDGQVDVAFAATSHDIAAPGLARIAAFGLTPSRVGPAADRIEQPLRIDLLRGSNETARNRHRRRLAFLATACLLVSLVVYAGSLIAQVSAAQRLADHQATLAQLRQQLVQSSGRVTGRQREVALLAEKKPENALFVLIDRLATIIPQDTFLDALDIGPAQIRIAGNSADASALIPLLEAEPGFSEAVFAAPVTRQEGGLDRFDISVRRRLVAAEIVP